MANALTNYADTDSSSQADGGHHMMTTGRRAKVALLRADARNLETTFTLIKLLDMPRAHVSASEGRLPGRHPMDGKFTLLKRMIQAKQMVGSIR